MGDISPQQEVMLLHALGLGEDNLSRTEPSRNRWADDPNGDTAALVAAGFFHDHGPHTWMGGMHAFTVTEAGKVYATRRHLALRDAQPKPTRARRRYLAWLHSDSGLRFGEWLKEAPRG